MTKPMTAADHAMVWRAAEERMNNVACIEAAQGHSTDVSVALALRRFAEAMADAYEAEAAKEKPE